MDQGDERDQLAWYKAPLDVATEHGVVWEVCSWSQVTGSSAVVVCSTDEDELS